MAATPTEQNWEQLIEDTGWELHYLTVPLVDGVLDVSDVVKTIDQLKAARWELKLIGYQLDEIQLCFRRALPDRDERVRQVQHLRAVIEGRQN